MSTTLTASFATRRDAEMTVERLVQEYGVQRGDIVVAPIGSANSVGEVQAGSDAASDSPSAPARPDAALAGRIAVSVALDDEARAGEVRAAFSEFAAEVGPSAP